jgi:hypothetical protein
MKPLPTRLTASRGRPWTLLLLAALTGVGAWAQEARTPSQFDYSSFRIISERNIFNAGRSGRSSAPRREESRPTRVDAFTLVGTMDYGKGPFAFFDGSSRDYRKVLPPGGSIAGHKVTEVSAGRVTLEAGTNQFEFKVGTQLRREDEGPWQLREHAEAFASFSSRSEFGRGDSRGFDGRRGDSRGNDSRRGGPRGSDSRRSDSRNDGSSETVRSSTPSAPAPQLSADQESEILKRLMQKREEESK